MGTLFVNLLKNDVTIPASKYIFQVKYNNIRITSVYTVFAQS